MVIRGHLRSIGYPQGMMRYLWANQVFLKNFGDHVEAVTERLKQASLAQAKASGRPIEYLHSSYMDKETIARDILARNGVRSGLLCVLSCLEPCWRFDIHRNREKEKLELQRRPGKCLFLYHYQIHPILGFLHARIISACISRGDGVTRLVAQPTRLRAMIHCACMRANES